MHSEGKQALTGRAWNVRLIYTIVNLYVLATILGIAFICIYPWSFSARTGLLLLLPISVFIIIPISVVFLWFLNRPCRNIHTKLQRKYLIMSRLFLAIVWIVACLPVGVIGAVFIIQEHDTKRVTTKIPLTGGHEYIVKTTIRPGFLDPYITKKASIRWASGRTEKLPYIYESEVSKVVEANGYVFLVSGQTLCYRPGTVSSIREEWWWWNLRNPTPSLYAFLRQYAKEHDDIGVTIEDGDIIRYASKQRYFFTGAVNGGFHLPHWIESIDPETLQLRMTSNESIASMPTHLIFSATNLSSAITWAFDEAATRNYECQIAPRD